MKRKEKIRQLQQLNEDLRAKNHELLKEIAVHRKGVEQITATADALIAKIVWEHGEVEGDGWTLRITLPKVEDKLQLRAAIEDGHLVLRTMKNRPERGKNN